MLWILCLALCSLLTPARADPGVLVRLGMDVLSREVQNAMNESHILEKMAAEAGQKRPGMKPIKGITDLKVKDVLLPVITMNFMPGVGVFQCVSTGMTITGKSFMGGNMEIIVVLNITATNRLLQDEETGLPMFKSEGCEVILVSVKTNLPSNMLPKVVNKFLDSTLHKVLPDLMCPAIDAVLVYVNKKWASLNAPMPVGQVGTVQYVLTSVPTTTASYIQVDFSPVVQKQKGNTIQLEDAGGAAFPEDYAEGSSQLLLSAAFLTAELALLQKSFDVKVKDTMVAEAYPKSKPLVTKIRINKSPKVTMKTGKSLLHLHGTLEMFAARRRGKPPVSLFVLETRFNLKIQYSVHEDRLQMTTSLDRLLSMSRRSSSIGPFKEKKLTGFITDFLQEAYIPVINDVLQVGFPLPDLLDMNYNLAGLDITENALVLDLKLD
ncbi:BPI fold-containing family B member 6 isoform X2 [Cervus elaphus]|uniref:BPI fold-containing family B member 6 isoform X2 n=1 Tax=Cervus canadensis TaxID=1574408 RepID=UPI001C9E83A8|nr:BPI fold-containing family B member 6 isoform X2 [Cervus canadensis]XP_043740054.1 BPI fold-containing family B member 6 isoform X2 [Cervus elaphus]